MSRMDDNFAIFILTHGRPDNILTLNTLKRMNYDGKLYFIIDNEDEKEDEYYKKYGKENVIMFDKLAISKTFDTGDNFDNRKTVVYARNACFDIAKKLGLKYFLELDDDYTDFCYRYAKGNTLKVKKCNDFNEQLKRMIDFLNCDKRIITVAFAQGGDFVGGANGVFKKKVMRKAMNSFFCDVDRYFQFVGRINEDVNTYATLGQKGNIILSITDFMLIQPQTQSNAGGMTDVYLDSGTYVKSFYTVMFAPSCAKVAVMQTDHPRIHHKILWNNCCPKIINEKFRK